ncbi:hypothetical protein [Poritiphilus flavus]|uniref:TolB-like 6-blade propeller-like n=1 Tax=Poritiphilus flavus TaxID=2697053 RepID=A0A6L9E848_9FLAO|nr:hypothetical protein [Poritiphilus flavus]NAS10870.1 hypothetical protein [Poritiphilus flavus]
MHFRSWFCLIFLAALFVGCSSDDDPLPESPSLSDLNFRVIGEDLQNIYQFNYDIDPAKQETINLTQENMVNRGYLILRQVDELLSFYSFSSGQFSAVLRDAATGESRLVENFYAANPERSVTWGINSQEQIFMGYLSQGLPRNLGVRTIDIATGEARDKIHVLDVNRVFGPLYFENRLILTYLDSSAEFNVAIVDTQQEEVQLFLNYGEAIPCVFTDDQGNIVVLADMGDGQFDYFTYDAQSLELIETRSFSLNEFFGPGSVPVKLIDDKLFFRDQYVQPSPVVFGPGIYDFANGAESGIDMITISQQVSSGLGTIVNITDFDFQNGFFLVSYSNLSPIGDPEGGVLIISEDSVVMEHIRLDFSPTLLVH